MDLIDPIGEVLIASDGSLPSQIAATLATQVASFYHWKVKGLYVVHAPYILNGRTALQAEVGLKDVPLTPQEQTELLQLKGEMAMEWLESLCRSLRVPFKKEIVEGAVDQELVQRSQGTKLVSCGKKGFHKPEDPTVLGENFYRFVHRIRAPLIVGGQGLRSIQTVLLAWDGSPGAANAMDWAARIAKVFQAKTVVVHVREQEDADELQQLEWSLQKGPLHLYQWELLKGGDVADRLAGAAIRYRADLLIVGEAHRSHLFAWPKETLLDRLFRATARTMLVVNSKGRTGSKHGL